MILLKVLIYDRKRDDDKNNVGKNTSLFSLISNGNVEGENPNDKLLNRIVRPKKTQTGAEISEKLESD